MVTPETITKPSARAGSPELPNVPLVETDGEPLDSTWHRDAINLLIEEVRYHRRDRKDWFAGGNMFIYFNVEQARNRDFRGPDFFYVEGVKFDPLRPYYVVWEEGGKYPDVLIELLSPTTADEDLTIKKTVYEKVFRTPDYFCYDPDTGQLQGWHLLDQGYEPLQPNERGWLWCAQLKLWLGTWTGNYQGCEATWLRFHDEHGKPVPLFAESLALEVEAERQRAANERQQAELARQQAEDANRRAEEAEAEVARLKKLLGERGDVTGED